MLLLKEKMQDSCQWQDMVLAGVEGGLIFKAKVTSVAAVHHI